MNNVESLFLELCDYIWKNGRGQMTCKGHEYGMEFDIWIVGRLKFDSSERLPQPVWFDIKKEGE